MADRPLSARAEHDAAQGSGFPDALAAGPYAGQILSPVYLTDSTSTLGGTATTGIKAYGAAAVTFDKGVLLGGTVALAESVATQLAQAIADQSS